jgi:uncharacterized phage-associated protein
MKDHANTDARTAQPRRLGYSVRGLANWILDHAETVGYRHTNMGINKLVYFAVEAFLVERNALLTNAKMEAWEHGPVFRELYQSFKSYGNGFIGGRAKSFSTASEEFEEAKIHLPPEEEAFLKSAIKPLLSCNASELRALSHREGGAWYSVWWYSGHTNPGMEISATRITQIGTGGVFENT